MSNLSYTLYCDDCRNILPTLDQQYDLILLDPPFLTKKKGYSQRNRHKNTVTGEWEPAIHQLRDIQIIPPEDYPAWWLWLCYECGKRLKSTGWFIFKADDYTDKSLYTLTLQTFDYYKNIPWDKKMPGIGYGVRNQHEQFALYRRYDHEAQYYADPTGFSSVITCANLNRGRFGKTSQQDHINQTPLEVWKILITQFCPPEGNILDPTMGSGSIEQAVKALNQRNPPQKRSCTGIEIDPEFFALAKKMIYPNTILDGLIK